MLPAPSYWPPGHYLLDLLDEYQIKSAFHAMTSHTLQEPTMKRFFLTRLFTIPCWVVVFTIASNIVLYRSGMALQNPYLKVDRAVLLDTWNEKDPRRSDVIFVGDSRTGNGFVPGVVDNEAHSVGTDVSSYNLAGPASTIPSDAGTIDYIVGRRAKPRLVVWGVGRRQTALFNFDDFQRNEATLGVALDLFKQTPDWQNVCTLGFCITRPFRILLQAPMRLLPQYRQKMETARRVKGTAWAYEIDAWSRAHNHELMSIAALSPAQRAEEFSKLSKHPEFITPFRSEPTIMEALRFGNRRARQNGIRVIVVNMPMHSARTAQEKAYGYDAYLRWIREVCREQELCFVDLNQPPWLPPDSEFVDSHHLSAQGAARLSRSFTREFIVPILKASPQGAQP